ncbi:MAG: hypothetical protein JO272_11680 [Pseudonocardiales bacterium]|nr:hypothetical protein [Pseudonocardiales bacterium]
MSTEELRKELNPKGEGKLAIRVGSVTACQTLPDPLRLGWRCASDQVHTEQLGRAMKLSVELGHPRYMVDVLSTRYLFGDEVPTAPNPYPNRLVAFWSTASGQQLTVADILSQKDAVEGYGHPVSCYAVPIHFVPPDDASIPTSQQDEVRVEVTLHDCVPYCNGRIAGKNGKVATEPQLVNWDMGAVGNMITPELADELGLDYDEKNPQVVVNKVNILDSRGNTTLELRNVHAIVDELRPESVLLGMSVLDCFPQVVLDFGTFTGNHDGKLLSGGIIRLLPNS